MVLASAWRWGLLLARAARATCRSATLTASFLVATFFNNFLPSNIGGDVIRIADTAQAAGSKTLATTVVLIDRGIGLLGLVLMAAIGATPDRARSARRPAAVGPGMLWAGFGVGGDDRHAGAAHARGDSTQAAAAAARLPPGVGGRAASSGSPTRSRASAKRPRRSPAASSARSSCRRCSSRSTWRSRAACDIPIGFAELAVIVPISFIVQMLPVSVNGFGVREATFGFYFTRLGLPLESALLVSFMGAALIMLFSLSGGVTYAFRKSHVPA